MYPLWSLAAMALAVPMYAAKRAWQSRMRELPDNISSAPRAPVTIATRPESPRNRSRVIQWISPNEFLSIHIKRSDLVVFDLRESAQRDPFPIPTAFALPVSPKELAPLLAWLPPDRSVVFYGASNLSIFLIETSPCMDGTATLYVLDGNLNLAEVA